MNNNDSTRVQNPNDTTNETEKKFSNGKCCGIYGLRNKLKPDRWYVGQSIDIEDRWGQYRLLRCKQQKKIYNALKKYGYEEFDKVLIEECKKELLNEREKYWIKIHNSFGKGYNLTEGGEGGDLRSGMKSSKEHKDKISKSLTGKKKSASHISHLPQNTKGWKQSPEFIEKRTRSICQYWIKRRQEQASQVSPCQTY